MNWRPDDWLGQPACCADCTFHPDSCYTCTGAYEFGAHAMLAALLKWLFEPCDNEHCVVSDIPPLIGKDRWIHTQHRKDCPQCLSELKEANK